MIIFSPRTFQIFTLLPVSSRIRKGTASEAALVSKVLPSMLLDFLPVQEVMNKIFSEFLSSQQPHPELIAQVAFEVCVISSPRIPHFFPL